MSSSSIGTSSLLKDEVEGKLSVQDPLGVYYLPIRKKLMLFFEMYFYLSSLSLSDFATHEIEWEGAFNAISSNIKVSSFHSLTFFWYFLLH